MLKDMSLFVDQISCTFQSSDFVFCWWISKYLATMDTIVLNRANCTPHFIRAAVCWWVVIHQNCKKARWSNFIKLHQI